MTLEKLQSEMIKAMKNKDKCRKQVLSNLIDRIKTTAINNNCRNDIPEALVDEVLLKYKKMVQEMIDTCPEDRQATLEDYRMEMAVVREFAPELITDEVEIKRIVNDIYVDHQVDLVKSNRGQIMKLISTNYKGKVDMSVVSKVVGSMLA